MKNQAQQCSKNASTQMTKIGCYVSNMEDKLITPGTYITAEEYHSKRLRAVRVLGGAVTELCSFCAFTVHDKCLYVCVCFLQVITLQSYVRRWLAKCFTDSLRQAKEQRLAWLENERRRKKEEKEQQIRDEYHRRMNPESKADFDLLYNALKSECLCNKLQVAMLLT